MYRKGLRERTIMPPTYRARRRAGDAWAQVAPFAPFA